MINAINVLLDNMSERFGNKVYREIVVDPMDTNYAP